MSSPTAEQQLVIDVTSGYWMVQACPGSGKTQTLLWRCKALGRLCRKLVLAFNKMAAEQVEARVQDTTVWAKTFHGFCYTQIRRDYRAVGYTNIPVFPNKAGFYGLLKQLNAACGTEYYTWENSPWDEDLFKSSERAYTHDINDRISTLQEIGEDDRTGADKLELSTLTTVIRFREWLIENNLITFDAMVRLVAENLDIIELDVEHVMVDEYQDVDQLQYDIVVHMAQMEGVESLLVVGDRNQSIYGWRGALGDPFRMLEYDLPGIQELTLTKNFRSYEPILQYAEKIASVGMTGVRGDGRNAVTKLGVGHGRTWILDGWGGGKDTCLSERIILCRYNLDCYRWQLALSRDGIPTNVFGKGDFWAMPHVKLAKRARTQSMTLNALLDSSPWQRFTKTKRYSADEDYQKECREDLEWVLKLTEADIKVLEEAMQDEERGLKISTIHKTKGKEFKRVLVNRVDGRLMQETEVFYVACTRAEDYLAIEVLPKKEWEQ